MQYTVYYEVSLGDQVVKDEMVVEAVSETRATEYAAHVLDEQYDDSVLLECRVIRKPGRPVERTGTYKRITLEISTGLLAEVDACKQSRREVIEMALEQFFAKERDHARE